MKIFVKNVEGLTLPKNGTELAAGYDIVATSEPKIVGDSIIVGETNKVVWKSIDYIEYETNLHIAPQTQTHHVLIYPRSSISKYNLGLANSIGLIDNDYRGMILCRFKYQWQPNDMWWATESTSDMSSRKILLGNPNMDKIYKKGDKIAQLVIAPTIQVEWELVDDLNETKRGSGGFGSTDAPSKPVFPPNTITTEGSNRVVTALVEKYAESGGVPVRKRYSDEVKNRNTQ